MEGGRKEGGMGKQTKRKAKNKKKKQNQSLNHLLENESFFWNIQIGTATKGDPYTISPNHDFWRICMRMYGNGDGR